MQEDLSTRMRLFALLFAVLFLVGAIVQWNDPDPTKNKTAKSDANIRILVDKFSCILLLDSSA